VRSIRRTIAWGELLVGLCVMAVSILLFLSVARRILLGQFDRSLLEKSSVFATLVEQIGAEVELHFADELMPRFVADVAPDYFQIWLDDGSVLERSLSLAGHDLPERHGSLDQPLLFDLELPDGRPGRAIGTRYPIHHLRPHPVTHAEPDRRDVVVVVAVGRHDLDLALRRLTLAGIALGLLGAGGLAFLSWKVVTRGLSPLERVRARLAELEDGRRASLDLEGPHLPSELEPVVHRIRSLTQGLQQSLAREKRLTANLAHELRTPVAELRALCESALLTPADGTFLQHALRENHAIALEMQRLLDTLLALARARVPMENAPRRPVQLAALVEQIGQGSRANPGASQVQIELAPERTSEPVLVHEDALRVVLSILLRNASQHAPAGSPVRVRIEHGLERTLLQVRNRAPGLRGEDRIHLGEPFWRAGREPTDSEHHGLGLALARECAANAGFVLDLDLDQGDFVARITLPASATPNEGTGAPVSSSRP
jgi:two-component system sensor histidine kinase QseC